MQFLPFGFSTYRYMKIPKLIIFDLDGTLIDAYAAIAGTFNYTMKRLGYPLQTADIIRRAVGGGDLNLLTPFVRKPDVYKALQIYRRHHAGALRAKARLYPSVRFLLASLKRRGIKLAVASNRPTRFSLIVLRHLGILKYFDYILCKDKLKYGKPHPLILNIIMRKFSIKPSETMYVGDMAIDAQTGRRAHVRSVVVTTGSSSRKELAREHPDHIIPRVSDVLALVRS